MTPSAAGTNAKKVREGRRMASSLRCEAHDQSHGWITEQVVPHVPRVEVPTETFHEVRNVSPGRAAELRELATALRRSRSEAQDALHTDDMLKSPTRQVGIAVRVK